VVSNAAEACAAADGEVSVRVRAIGAPGGGTAPLVELVISDTGPGIPRAHLGRLFVPGFTTKETGSGVGLAIAERVVAAHHGRITVDSEEGRGTTITITLPTDKTRAPAACRCGTPAERGNRGVTIGTIVCVDDQAEVRRLLADVFRVRGSNVVSFDDGEDAIAWLGTNDADLAVLDLDLGPGRRSGIEICRAIRARLPDLPIIILTGHGTIDDAVAAVKAGAVDFVTKDPYLEDKLEISVEKVERILQHALDRKRLEDENRELRATNERLRKATGRRWQIVGDSPLMRQVMTKIEKVAPVPRPVLVLGPRGTGKELVARAVHTLSPRASEPYITINCAAVAESLLESELFGHEEGAFTGATKQKEGKFELADGGTLFLDEIGNMSLEFQAKILRVLEYQRFERVAGSESIQVNVRVIAATNLDLKQAMLDGKFRPDLYDRLAFEVINLPSLAQRMQDVPVLAAHFLIRFRQEVAGISVKEISADALDRFASCDTGNVRELRTSSSARSTWRRAVLTAADVDAALPPRPAPRSRSRWRSDNARLALPERVDAFEAWLCKDALDARQAETAALLSLSTTSSASAIANYSLGKD
jgi:DNA-binding NtrC family response regulator/anti-sigma regulatory factor (Ser/Thr protein kinase)